MIKNIIIIFLFAAVTSIYPSDQVVKEGNNYYIAGKIVVKFKNKTPLNKKLNNLPAALSKKLEEIGFSEITPFFDEAKGENKESINSIAVLKSYSPQNSIFLISKLIKLKEVEWAEPYYVYPIAVVPDDPKYLDNSQWNLKNIEAEAAWDISTGSEDVVIGIVDTGVDWDHPDLRANIWENDDPINGVDDDNNGYVDDLYGWDFGGEEGIPDNEPNEDQPDHGTHVAGIASAVTNNGVGIASIGYNCKLMPVKVSQNNIRSDEGLALVSYGYQGIIYAVDNGADIINCSWGSNGFSSLGNDVIQYAVANGSLIVGAAGNEDNDGIIYPAAYEGVLSVGAVNIQDIRTSYSNYGKRLDVVAPGGDGQGRIYSTWKDDDYIQIIGTSMAAPLVAGLAALVKSRVPELHPLQIAEQIRVNTDDIYSLNHSSFNRLLGTGRINARKALTNFSSVSVRATDYEITEEGNQNGVLESGESFKLKIDFLNLLNPVNNLKITINSNDAFSTVLNPEILTGSVNTGQAFSNQGNEFIIQIDENAPENFELDLLLEFNQETYSDYQWLSTLDIITVNPTYVNQNANRINFTIAAEGAFAFNDYPNNEQGTGFTFDDSPNLMFEGALIYGTDSLHVMDHARILDNQSSDFMNITSPQIVQNGSVEEVFTVFNDDGAGTNKLNIETQLRSYAYKDEGNDNYILLDFDFINNNENDISNFYAGLFFDWDIGISGQGDKTSFNTNQNFGYAYNTEGIPVGTYVGSALLSSDKYKYNAINNDGSNNSINIYDGFTDVERWESISGINSKASSDIGDISFVVAGGPFQIPKNDSLKVGFSLAAAEDLSSLENAVSTSRAKYLDVVGGNEPVELADYQLFNNYPNPFNSSTNISFILKENREVSLKIYDILGREIAVLINNRIMDGQTRYRETFNAKEFNLASGVYLYRLTTDNFSDSKKMIYLK